MPAAPRARGFNCRNCGAAVELRALAHTRAVACTSCAAILDPADPTLAILQEAAARQTHTPKIPLGSRGRIGAHPFEVIGFQFRTIDVEGEQYGWDEYVLFNPYQGFRYLTEYQGHWNLVRSVPVWPNVTGGGATLKASAYGEAYRHFQTATATTRFVMGEFPWRVRAGDVVDASDFVAPPKMMSRERAVDDVAWSVGEYMSGAAVWKAFELPGEPPPAIGVFANQPNPNAGRAAKYWQRFGLLALTVLALLAWRAATASREVVFQGRYSFVPGSVGEPAFTTEPFTLRDGGTVEVNMDATVNNAWLYLDLALVNTTTGTALNVGKEIGYYTGTDSDGAWSEGTTRERLLVPWVPAGEYYLRVEPEGSGITDYTVRLRRDVVSLAPYLIAVALLLLWPVAVGVRSLSFESRRWAESDAGSAFSSDDGDGGDDDD